MAETGNETCGYGGWTLVMKIHGNKVSLQSFRGHGSLAELKIENGVDCYPKTK